MLQSPLFHRHRHLCPILVAGELHIREHGASEVIKFNVTFGSNPMPGSQSGAEPREEPKGVRQLRQDFESDSSRGSALGVNLGG